MGEKGEKWEWWKNRVKVGEEGSIMDWRGMGDRYYCLHSLVLLVNERPITVSPSAYHSVVSSLLTVS